MDAANYGESMRAQPLTTPIDSFDYNMNHKHRGFCLILENETFAPHGLTKGLGRRVGSHVDSESLVKLFTKLEFNVLLRKNLTTSGIVEILKCIANVDHSDYDCFACFVLSHGDHEHLYSSDGRYVIDWLFLNFLGDRCPTLLGKPKLFFIQACQGDRLDPGVVVTALDSAKYFKIPTYADFMIAYSTLPGFYSFRNTEKGSWFIRAIVQVFQDHHLDHDLLSMMTMVSHYVSYRFTSNAITPATSGMKQVPCISSMLTRRVYFHPKSIHL